MPCFNAESTLEKSINSILNQSYKNFELLVCDDCSLDGTWEVLLEFAARDKRVKLFRNETNSGPAVARNRCIDNATGDWLAFLDSDDQWDSDFLRSQLDFLLKENKKFICAGSRRVNEKEESIRKDLIPPPRASYSDICKSNSISCLTAVVSRSLVGDTRMKSNCIEDLNFWLDLLKTTDFVFGNQKCIATYMVRDGSRSSNKLKLIPMQWKTYREKQKIGLAKSIYYLINWAIRGYLKNKK